MRNNAKGKGADQEKVSLPDRINDFIIKNRVVVIGVGIAALVVIVGIGIFSAVSASRQEASTTALEAAEKALSTWRSESDPAKKTAAEASLLASFDSVAANWPDLFAARRSLSMKASFLSEKKDFKAAEDLYLQIADRWKSDEIAPIALQNAAIAAEERGAPDVAISYLERISSEYGKDSILLGRVSFSLGRLYEAAKNWSKATASYQAILDGFPQSDLAKLAKDRLIALKAQGLIP